MKKDSFIFYRSFFEAIDTLPRDIQGEIYRAIVRYGITGEETECLKPIARSLFILMKPQIDANTSRYENGCKGGRPKAGGEDEKPNGNQTETKPKPNGNQTETKPKPNGNQTETERKPNRNQTETERKPNDNDNDNVNVNNLKKREKDKSFSKESAKKPPGVFRPPTVEEVRDYVQQKGYPVDAEMFVDFYASKGWMVGKNRMKDWQAAVRTWKRKREEDPYNYGTTTITKNGNATNPNFNRQGTRGNIFTGEQLDAIIEASQKLDELDNGR